MTIRLVVLHRVRRDALEEHPVNGKSVCDELGAEAIAPQSRAPHTHPRAVPNALRNEIIDVRKQLTRHGLDAGPETIAYHLEQAGKRAPSTSTIRRILTNEGLITPPSPPTSHA